jgi:hypothetical protein
VPESIQIEAALLLDDFAKLDFAEFPLVNQMVEGMMKKGMGFFSFVKERFTEL